MSEMIRRCRGRRFDNRGAVLVAAVVAMAAIVSVAAIALRRSMTTSNVTSLEKTQGVEDAALKSVVALTLLKVKNYAWVSGQSVQQLLPSNGDRFKTWNDGGGTYNGVSYTVSLGDNWEVTEGASQNYFHDADGKAYVLITATIDGRSRQVRVLMSPGGLPSPNADATPAQVPGAVGVCYGKSNLMTLVTMKTGSLLSGFDKFPPGMASCPSSPTADDLAEGGTCDSWNDQPAIASTSKWGVFDLGQIFDISSLQGTVEGISEMGNPTVAAGRPTQEDCATYDAVRTTVDSLVGDGDTRVALYQQNGTLFSWKTKYVNGDLTFGSTDDPRVVYVKTNTFGTVQFNGSVTGAGVLIAAGNAKFKGPVTWTGMVINDANTLLSVMSFENSMSVYGGVVINRPWFSAEIGAGSYDIRMLSNNTFVRFSQPGLDRVLSQLDDGYTSPLAPPGKAVGLYSIEYL